MDSNKNKTPVGRIDFLSLNGTVEESVYYYSEKEFVKSVNEENYYGVPMIVNVFRDENGQTIPLDFVNDFDPLPQGFKIINYKKEGNKMNEFQKLAMLAKRYKALYPEGTRIEVLMMGNDPRPINPGTRGTVKYVDDIGTIHCKFDDGRLLGLIPGEDSFRKLTQSEILDEQSEKLSQDFIEKVNNEVIPSVGWYGMKAAYKNGDMTVPTDLLRMLHEKYLEVYGTNHIESTAGMVTVPGLVLAADGNIYPALLDIDACSSGEHWGTTFFTPYGVLSDMNDDIDVQREIKKLVPYKYWYTTELETDHHVDWESCPESVNKILNEATQQSQIDEVRMV